MCLLCGSKSEREEEAERFKIRAETLEQLAVCYWRLAAGTLKPHTHDMRTVELLQKRVIRICAEEF